jgi:hypothetical protein
MMRSALAATGVVVTLALAACGSTPASSTGSNSTASPSGNANANARRGGTAGELVRINGSSLVVSTQSGDVNVSVGSSTPVTKTRTGSVADITNGTCIVATGTKNVAGVLTASTVRIGPMVNGSCTGTFGGPGGPGGGNPNASPDPSRSPRPSPGGTPPAFARGQVTTVSGTAVTLQDASNNNAATTITVPTTVRVSVSQTITATGLSVGDCVLANGQKDTAGTVQARSVNVVPPGPSGCFTGGAGGGFGRGGGFGGGGGAAPNGGPPAGAGA